MEVALKKLPTSRQKNIALAKQEKNKFHFLKHNAKRVGKGRNANYPAAAKFVIDTVSSRWDSDPVTPNELYKLTSRNFHDVPEMVTFKRIHLDPKKRNRFSTWVK